ncbi:MAG: glycosyltransferase [Armatimonadota bacterium]|nr:glycosyltransferase [Armatimonadota bacterium]
MVVWVILPAFNEAENLPGLLSELDALATDTLPGVRVVLVDDGSTDATGEIARSWAGPCRPEVIAHGANRGLAAAVLTGLRAAVNRCGTDDVIVTMDADGSHRPAQIPAMVREIADGADVIIASRYRPGARTAGVSAIRSLYSLGARALLSVLFPIPGVRDYTCGFRAYRAALLGRARQRYGDRWIESQGFSVMTEILLKLRPLRPVVREVPIDLRYDLKRGRSKLVAGRTIRQYLGMIVRLRLRT